MSFVKVETAKIDALASKLGRLDSEALGRASTRALNLVVNRGFELGVRTMLTGVNLPESYVKDRMGVEEAKDISRPSAKIIAFRSGGKRPGIRPVNLRQYDPKIGLTLTNWRNNGMARNSAKQFRVDKGAMYENPRKPGTKLPFKKRVGNRVLGIPIGQKVESISVEVIKGRRKMLKPVGGFKAFMQRMPNGEVLVMRRTTKNGGKGNKGKIEALYSLSVAQLFNFIAKKDNEKARRYRDAIYDDLETTVTEEVIDEIRKAVNQ